MLGAYYQVNRINVIPNVSWSDQESFKWCLTAIPKNSIISISSNGCLNKATKHIFANNLKQAVKTLKPIELICVGKLPEDILSELPKKLKVTMFNSHSDNMRLRRGA